MGVDDELEPLDDDAFDALEFVQDGVDLFGEELPSPEPPCDIASDEGILLDEVVDGQVDEDSVIEAAMLDDDPEDPDDEPVFAVAGAEELESVDPDAELAELDTAAAPSRPTAPTSPAEHTAPLALYRRYRPDTFAEVIGQEHVTEPLMRAIANNKVNHAYLFSGPRGCGKTTSARILARCLNCEQGPTPTPCGVCDSCVALATGGPGSIDVIEIDAASHGRVDDARELREGVYFAPVHSRFKIYIIDEAHMVTKEGFNALLKVVEEPPEHVKFIFATTEPDKVIGTIRSRTHHYPFRLVPPRVLGDYLEQICAEEGVEVDRGVLPLVVRAGAGSVRDSLSVLDQLLGAADHGRVTAATAAGLLGYTPETLLDEIVDAFAAGDGRGVFATIDKVIETGQDPRRFAEDLLERMRDLVIVAQVPEAIESRLIDVPDDQAERLRAQAAALGPGELTRAAEVIATGLVQMRGTTAPRLHLELICSRILLPATDRDERGINARLDRLERRLEMGGVPVEAAPSLQEARTWSPEPPATQQQVRRPVEQRAPRPAPEPVAQPTDRSVAPQPRVQRAPEPPTQQRPAAQTPADQRPAAPAPEPVQPVDPMPAAAPAGPGTADVRRLWPQILDEVKSRRRFTHALISQNAHVIEVRSRELLLGFSSPGTMERFNGGGSADVLRDSIIQVMGVDLRIQVSVDGGPSHEDSRQTTRPTSFTPPPAPPAQPPRPVQQTPEPEPHVPGQQRPAGQPPAEHIEPAQYRPETPPEPEPDPDEEVAPDDVVIDDAGIDAAELLARELGAQIIEEDDRG